MEHYASNKEGSACSRKILTMTTAQFYVFPAIACSNAKKGCAACYGGKGSLGGWKRNYLPLPLCRLSNRQWASDLHWMAFAITSLTDLDTQDACCMVLQALTLSSWVSFMFKSFPRHLNKPDHSFSQSSEANTLVASTERLFGNRENNMAPF